jgi:hypothetical protein
MTECLKQDSVSNKSDFTRGMVAKFCYSFMKDADISKPVNSGLHNLLVFAHNLLV